MKVPLDQKQMIELINCRKSGGAIDISRLSDVQLIHLAAVCLGFVARLNVDRGLVGDFSSPDGAEIVYDAALLQRASQTAVNLATATIDLFQDPSHEIFFAEGEEIQITDET